MTNIIEILDINSESIRVTADMGDYVETFDIALPCLITVDKGIRVPRLPSYRLMLASAGREIPVLTAADLSADAALFGLDGSPTKVERIYPPDARGERRVLEGRGEDIADMLFDELRTLKFI
jgi:electron transfer flavoprotein beta subunit